MVKLISLAALALLSLPVQSSDQSSIQDEIFLGEPLYQPYELTPEDIQTSGSAADHPQLRAIYTADPQTLDVANGTLNYVYELNNDDRLEFVKAHNEWRNSAAGGNLPWTAEYPNPDDSPVYALGLHRFRYDMELERNAVDFARQCIWAHSRGLGHTRNPHSYGENMFLTGASTPDRGMLRSSVNAWGNEFRFYSHKTRQTTGVVGHYTAMIWGSTVRVGCGVAACHDFAQSGTTDGVVIVCQYFTAGNYVGATPFEFSSDVAELGSNCPIPFNMDLEYPNLCADQGDICATGVNDRETNRCNLANSASVCVPDTTSPNSLIENSEPSDYNCDCSKFYRGRWCRTNICDVNTVSTGLGIGNNKFFGTMFWLCSDGVPSVNWCSPGNAYQFGIRDEALDACEELGEECVGVVYSLTFWNSYRFYPIHVNPTVEPEKFDNTDENSYFIQRDCSPYEENQDQEDNDNDSDVDDHQEQDNSADQDANDDQDADETQNENQSDSNNQDDDTNSADDACQVSTLSTGLGVGNDKFWDKIYWKCADTGLPSASWCGPGAAYQFGTESEALDACAELEEEGCVGVIYSLTFWTSYRPVRNKLDRS